MSVFSATDPKSGELKRVRKLYRPAKVGRGEINELLGHAQPDDLPDRQDHHGSDGDQGRSGEEVGKQGLTSLL